MGNVEKLQKIIGASGVCSRRKAEELIEKGLVTVNGQTAKIGDRADIDIDEIVVDGKKLEKQKAFIYVMLNKPRGYVTTAKDENGRKCVTELVEDIGERVYPVGRLDMYSEGLLLMTNDGDFAYKMTHPRHEMLKEYIVRIKGEGKEPEKVLSLPMDIDGYKINPAIVRLISSSEDVYCVSIKISEGRNIILLGDR